MAYQVGLDLDDFELPRCMLGDQKVWVMLFFCSTYDISRFTYGAGSGTKKFHLSFSIYRKKFTSKENFTLKPWYLIGNKKTLIKKYYKSKFTSFFVNFTINFLSLITLSF